MPGVEDVGSSRPIGQPNLTIKVDRSHSARYGLTPGDINAVVQAAIGGQPVTDIYEGERHFPLVVRLAPEYRGEIEALKTFRLQRRGLQGVYTYHSVNSPGHLQSGASYIIGRITSVTCQLSLAYVVVTWQHRAGSPNEDCPAHQAGRIS